MRVRVSYHPLCLADVTVRTVVVHRRLAQPVLSIPLQVSYELYGRPPLAQPVPGLQILDQPIDRPLKVLLLGQVDAMRQHGLHLLLQDLRVEHGDRYQAGVLDGVLDHLTRSLVEDNIGHVFANAFRQMKMFLRGREN
jgi:hypothetical protein